MNNTSATLLSKQYVWTGWLARPVLEWIDRWTDGWVEKGKGGRDRRVVGWRNRQMDWVDGWVDRWMDKRHDSFVNTSSKQRYKEEMRLYLHIKSKMEML